MAIEPGRMMSYIDWLSPMKLHNPWSRKERNVLQDHVTNQNIISPLKQCLWLLNQASYLAAVIVPVPFYFNFILFVNTRSC